MEPRPSAVELLILRTRRLAEALAHGSYTEGVMAVMRWRIQSALKELEKKTKR